MAEAHGGLAEAVLHEVGGLDEAAALVLVAHDGLDVVGGRRRLGHVEEALLHGALFRKAAHTHADEAQRRAGAPYLVDHGVEQRRVGQLVVARLRQLALHRAHAQVVELHAQRERAAVQALAAQAAPHLRRHRGDGGLHVLAAGQIRRERHLVGHRLHGIVLLNRRVVAAVRPHVHHAPELAKHALEHAQIGVGQLPQRADAARFQLLLGRCADAAHHSHGQRSQKVALAAGVDHSEAARLVHVRGDLRDGLGGACADGARHPQLLHAPLDALGHPHRMLAVHRGGRDVQERLVDTHLLHVRRLGAQDGHDGVGHLAVAVEAPVCPDGVGAQAARRRRGHGASHPVGPRLVGGGGHHAVLVRIAAHDDGLATPGRVVQLLDRGEERVQVHQQDGRPLPRLERQRARRSFPCRRAGGAVARCGRGGLREFFLHCAN